MIRLRINDRFLRIALWTAVLVNTAGVGLFVAAATGHPSPLLPIVPEPFYAAQLALIIGLFGGVYGWLALQKEINRPLLLVGALGKLGFFALFPVYWSAGEIALSKVLAASPDLLLGLTFSWWLRTPIPVPTGRKRVPDGLPANRFLVRPLSQSSRSAGRRAEDG